MGRQCTALERGRGKLTIESEESGGWGAAHPVYFFSELVSI